MDDGKINLKALVFHGLQSKERSCFWLSNHIYRTDSGVPSSLVIFLVVEHEIEAYGVIIPVKS